MPQYNTATAALLRLRAVYSSANVGTHTVAQVQEIIEAGIAAEQPLVAVALEYEARLLESFERLGRDTPTEICAKLDRLKALLDPIRPPPVPPSYEELTETLKAIVATAANRSEARDLAQKMLERMPK